MRYIAFLMLQCAILHVACAGSLAYGGILERGRDYHASGNFEFAALFFGAALEEGPFKERGDYTKFYNAGLSLYMRGGYASSAYVFSLLAEQYPSSPSLDRIMLYRGLSEKKTRANEAYICIRDAASAFPPSLRINAAVTALTELEADITGEVINEISSPFLFKELFAIGCERFEKGDYAGSRVLFGSVAESSYERDGPYGLSLSSLRMLDALWQPSAARADNPGIPGGLAVFATFNDSGCFGLEGEKIFLNKNIEYLYNLGYYKEAAEKLKIMLENSQLGPGERQKYLKAAGFSAYYAGQYEYAYDCFNEAYWAENGLGDKLSLLVKMALTCRQGGLRNRSAEIAAELELIMRRLEAEGLMPQRQAGYFSRLKK